MLSVLFTSDSISVRLYWSKVLHRRFILTGEKPEMNILMKEASNAGLYARPVDQQLIVILRLSPK